MASAETQCPKCGTRNRPDAAYCNLCQESLRRAPPAPGLPGAVRLAPGGTAAADAGGPSGAVPMLSFYEAAARNVRMSRLLFLLLFSVFFGLGTAIGNAYGRAWHGVALAVILYAILAGAAYFQGSSIVLRIHGAREADPSEHGRLMNVVDEMRIASGLPMPRVYLLASDGMNAFAAGRSPAEAAVAVTTGLLAGLKREELQGVIAHEMAHIKSRDTLYNVCAAVLVGSIALLADLFLRGTLFRGRRGAGGRGNVAAFLLGAVFALLAPLAARLLRMSISRQREYHADAEAAAFTRNPLGLASALERIAESGAHVPATNRGTQHLFIVNPLLDFPVGSSALLSTHPPTALRIQRLRAMAGLGARRPQEASKPRPADPVR